MVLHRDAAPPRLRHRRLGRCGRARLELPTPARPSAPFRYKRDTNLGSTSRPSPTWTPCYSFGRIVRRSSGARFEPWEANLANLASDRCQASLAWVLPGRDRRGMFPPCLRHPGSRCFGRQLTGSGSLAGAARRRVCPFLQAAHISMQGYPIRPARYNRRPWTLSNLELPLVPFHQFNSYPCSSTVAGWVFSRSIRPGYVTNGKCIPNRTSSSICSKALSTSSFEESSR